MVCAASWTIISSHCADLNSSLIILVSLCRVYFKTDHPYSQLPYYDSVYLLLGIIIVVHEKRYYIRYKRVINFQLASAICFHSLGKEIILRIFFSATFYVWLFSSILRNHQCPDACILHTPQPCLMPFPPITLLIHHLLSLISSDSSVFLFNLCIRLPNIYSYLSFLQ